MGYNVKMKHYKSTMRMVMYERPIMTGFSLTDEEKHRRAKARRENSGYSSDDSEAVSVGRTKVKIHDLAIMNDWDYFVTFTFDPKKVDRYDYSAVSRKMSSWLNNIRRVYAPDLKYMVVPELHQDGAVHFHGLIANIGNIGFFDSGYTDHQGRKIYNLDQYKHGWSTATPVTNSEAVSKYITKYVTKELLQVAKNKKRYWNSKNLEMPKEVTFTLPKSGKQELICEYEKRTISAKTVQIDTESYTNTLDIRVIDTSL